MSLVTGPHTVLVFKKIQFQGQWTRWSGTTIIGYTPTDDKDTLLVVVEKAPGQFITYWFRVAKGLDVWVGEGQSVVHIPALCIKSEDKDAIVCG
jgi:hypothetical protein